MQEPISQDSSEQQVVRDLNESFRDYLPEYAKVDLEVFETIDKPGERLTEIPKPGLREHKSINNAFKNGQPVTQYDPEYDQIEAFAVRIHTTGCCFEKHRPSFVCSALNGLIK